MVAIAPDGASLASLVNLVEPGPAARYSRLDSFDNSYTRRWDLESAPWPPQTILAYAFNDHLRLRHARVAAHSP